MPEKIIVLPFASGWHLLGPRLFHKIQGGALCVGGVLWEQSLQRENPLPGEESAVCPGDRAQRRRGGYNPMTSLFQAKDNNTGRPRGCWPSHLHIPMTAASEKRAALEVQNVI